MRLINAISRLGANTKKFTVVATIIRGPMTNWPYYLPHPLWGVRFSCGDYTLHGLALTSDFAHEFTVSNHLFKFTRREIVHILVVRHDWTRSFQRLRDDPWTHRGNAVMAWHRSRVPASSQSPWSHLPPRLIARVVEMIPF